MNRRNRANVASLIALAGLFACSGAEDEAPPSGAGGMGTVGTGGETASGGTSLDSTGGMSPVGSGGSTGGVDGTGGVLENTGGSTENTGGAAENTGGAVGNTGGMGSDPDVCPSVSDPNVTVELSNGQWQITGQGGDQTAGSLTAALGDAFSRLTPNRSQKESIVVLGDGSMGNNERIEIPSYTILDVCGTIDVINAGGSGDQSPFYGQNKTDIEIPHATITGVPLYAMFFRRVNNLTLGKIDIRLGGSGFGIRIDNDPSNHAWGRSDRVTNVQIDEVYVEGTSNHGVETYGVDGITIGQVVARNVGYAGLLLNATVNAEVGLVDGEDVATGQGYAAFRIANEAGREGTVWNDSSIHVGMVRARRGGRGIFCVSDSGGLTVDEVDIADTGNNSMLLENCHNTQIGVIGGTVSGGGEIRVSQRADEHTPTSNLTIQNLNITGTSLRESPCGNNVVVCNIESTGNVDVCGEVMETCP